MEQATERQRLVEESAQACIVLELRWHVLRRSSIQVFVRGSHHLLQSTSHQTAQRKKISDQTQVTGRFLGGQGLDETRNQARRAFVLTHLETWCQVNFL